MYQLSTATLAPAPDVASCFQVLDARKGRDFEVPPELMGRRGLLHRAISAPAAACDRGAARLGERLFLFSDPPDCTGDVAARIRWHRETYGDPELLRSPDRFYRPPAMPARVALRRLSALPEGERLGMTFRSTYVTFDPEHQQDYDAFEGNETVHARLLLHRRPGRATVVCINPWCGGYPTLEERLFDARALYRRGLDVALFTMPFHGRRTPRQAYFPGQLFPNRELRRTDEGFGQAVCDLRVLMAWLRQERGAGPIGLMGMSLGGYTTALMAALEPRLAFGVVLMAPCSLADGLWLHGAHSKARLQAESAGFHLDDFRVIWAIHTPLVLPRRTPRERLLLLFGEGDRLIPASHQLALWEHWGRPPVASFPGGHLLQAGRAFALREARRFIERAL